MLSKYDIMWTSLTQGVTMKVVYIASKEAFMESIENVMKADTISFDIETSGLNSRIDDVLLIQINAKNVNYIYDITKLPQDKIEYILNIIKDKLLIGFNIKFDIQFIFEKYGILYTKLYDIMIVEKVITAGIGDRYPSLADVIYKYFDVEVNKETRKLFHELSGDISTEMIEYAATDIYYLQAIKSLQEESIKSLKLERTVKVEMDILPAVADMELNGMLLDVDEWKKLTRHAIRFTRLLRKIIDRKFNLELERFLEEHPETNALETLEFFKITRDREVELRWKADTGFEKRAYRKAYEAMLTELVDPKKIIDIFFLHFNPNSNTQKKKMLNWMGIITESINQKVLKRDFPEDRFVRTMIRFAEEFKKAYTYGENMLEHIDPKSGRIHANASQMGTTTGRFAYSKPNLQNQISDSKYRKCYIARDGHKILTADYSQIELRVLAEITGEERMINAYINREDIHGQTATFIYGVPLDDITLVQRKRGKGTNFGIVYGATARGLAYNFEMTEAEAVIIQRKMKLAYPVLASFMTRAYEEILTRGYAVTPLGRKRFFRVTDFIRSAMGTKERLSIQRQGFNHIVQGCAADIMKIAIVNIWWNNPFGRKLRLLATVHDEVVIEIADGVVDDAVDFVDRMMTMAGEIFLSRVPVVVDKTVEPYWIK